MKALLPKAARRVQDYLVSKNSDAKVQMLPESTATAKDAAIALGIDLRHIGKSIVFGNADVLIVAIVCGNQRVDLAKITKELRINDIKSLDPKEVKRRTEYSIGGVSPFALPDYATIIIDVDLYDLCDCYVAAGHPKAVVKTNGVEIVAITNALPVRVT